MEAVRVLVTLDLFWHHMRSLTHLGLLVRTSKTIRSECDLAYAVAASGLDRGITKKWAERWLGLRMSWMYIGDPLTLVRALNIMAERGGISSTYKHGAELRAREADKKEQKRLQIDENVDRIRREKAARAVVMKRELDNRLADERIPRAGEYYVFVTENLIPRGMPIITDDHIKRIQRSFETQRQSIRKHAERKIRLDAVLTAAGLPTAGTFYDNTLRAPWVEINDALVAEMRFRVQFDAHPERGEFVKRYEKGALADYARARFRLHYHVDDDGNIGACKRKLRKLK